VTEARAAQAGPTTMATMPPEAEARREAEARTEDADAAADRSAAAGPTGATAAALGENRLSGTSAGTNAKLTVFLYVFSTDLMKKLCRIIFIDEKRTCRYRVPMRYQCKTICPFYQI
jgi:hypothetical protein